MKPFSQNAGTGNHCLHILKNARIIAGTFQMLLFLFTNNAMKELEHIRGRFPDWAVTERKDTAPRPHMYHFYAPAEALQIFPVTRRPLIQMDDGLKLSQLKPSLLNFMPDDAGMTLQKHYVWRIFEGIYPTIEDWVEEVGKTGQIICWIPSKDGAEGWARRPRAVLLAHENGFHDRSGRKLPVIFGSFMPTQVRYVIGNKTTLEYAAQIEKFGANLRGLIGAYTASILEDRAIKSVSFNDPNYKLR